jgi:hypothetical protein
LINYPLLSTVIKQQKKEGSMKPEERIRRRVGVLLDCANLMEVSRRTGIPRTTLRNWQQEPLRIKALDLEKLEDLLGKGKERYK